MGDAENWEPQTGEQEEIRNERGKLGDAEEWDTNSPNAEDWEPQTEEQDEGCAFPTLNGVGEAVTNEENEGTHLCSLSFSPAGRKDFGFLEGGLSCRFQ